MFRFTVVMVSCCFRSLVNNVWWPIGVCAIILAQVYCTLQYVSDVVVKQFTFAISSLDELLVIDLMSKCHCNFTMTSKMFFFQVAV